MNLGQMMAEMRNSLPSEMKQKKVQSAEKYGNSWTHQHEPEYYLRRAEEEFYEFRQAVEHDRDLEAAMEELADVCNFALMYAIRSYADERRGDV